MITYDKVFKNSINLDSIKSEFGLGLPEFGYNLLLVSEKTVKKVFLIYRTL